MVERHSGAVKRIFLRTKEGKRNGVEVALGLVHNGDRSASSQAREKMVAGGSKTAVISRLKEASTLLGISGATARAEAFAEASEIILAESPDSDLGAWLRQRRSEASSVNDEVAWAEALDTYLGRRSGTVERLRKGLPPDVVKLLRIRGMSPGRISRSWRELGVTDIESLKCVLREGRLVAAGILDVRTAAELPRIIQEYEAGAWGWKKPEVSVAAKQLLEHLRVCPQVEQLVLVGDLAMGQGVVERVEVLIASRAPMAVGSWLAQWPPLGSKLVEMERSWVFQAGEALPCRVWVCEPEQFVVESYRLSGHASHWQGLVKVAEGLGWALEGGYLQRHAPWGVEQVSVRDHAELLRHLNLAYIEPELRQGLDEIELAAQGRLPTLLGLGDIRGDLHSHSVFSDGSGSPEAMLEEAKARGYEYFTITDHTKGTWMAGGMGVSEVEEYLSRLNRVRQQRDDIHLLVGLEVDILADGSLDMPDEILSRMDVVIASVHSMFHLTTQEQLQRIRRAMEHPAVHMLAHPTARLLGRRSALPIPLEDIVEMARETGTWLELNCNPERLDLPAPGLMLCRKAGVPVAISSDAHHEDSLSQMEWGISEARRGGLEAGDVMNTRPLDELVSALKQKSRRSTGR